MSNQTEPALKMSDDSSQSSNATLNPEQASIDFLESPAIDLVKRPLDEYSDAEINALVEFYRTLTKVPGARQRRMKDESVVLKTGKPRKQKYNDDDLI